MRLLPIAATVFFLVFGVGLRLALHWIREGSFGLCVFRRGGWTLARDTTLTISMLMLEAQAVLVAAWPGSLDACRIAPLGAGEVHQALAACGAGIVVIGTVLIAFGQWWLGPAWRIGIDPDARPGLVTDGPFRFCRNPIFASLMVVVIGFVLMLPTWASLLAMAGVWVSLRAQAKAEERHLAWVYEEAYREYAARVGRFVPGVGRVDGSAAGSGADGEVAAAQTVGRD